MFAVPFEPEAAPPPGVGVGALTIVPPGFFCPCPFPPLALTTGVPVIEFATPAPPTPALPHTPHGPGCPTAPIPPPPAPLVLYAAMSAAVPPLFP